MNDAPLLYRFTVKCDRDTNRAIEKLAKACNVSASAYVQRHFETITVDAAVSIAPIKLPLPSIGFKFIEPKPAPPPKPVRIRKSPPGERILLALLRAKRADGTVCLSQPLLSDAAQTSIPTLIKYLEELIRDGSIEIASEGRKGKPTAYRVLVKPEGNAP